MKLRRVGAHKDSHGRFRALFVSEDSRFTIHWDEGPGGWVLHDAQTGRNLHTSTLDEAQDDAEQMLINNPTVRSS